MAHRVAVTTHANDLPKAGAGINLTIHKHGAVLGRLTIGRGGIKWNSWKKSIGRSLTWPTFARLMAK